MSNTEVSTQSMANRLQQKIRSQKILSLIHFLWFINISNFFWSLYYTKTKSTVRGCKFFIYSVPIYVSDKGLLAFEFPGRKPATTTAQGNVSELHCTKRRCSPVCISLAEKPSLSSSWILLKDNSFPSTRLSLSMTWSHLGVKMLSNGTQNYKTFAFRKDCWNNRVEWFPKHGMHSTREWQDCREYIKH